MLNHFHRFKNGIFSYLVAITQSDQIKLLSILSVLSVYTKRGVSKDSFTYSNFTQILCEFRNLIYGWNSSKSKMKFLQIFLFMIVNEKTSAILKMILMLYEFHSLNKVSLLIKGKITKDKIFSRRHRPLESPWDLTHRRAPAPNLNLVDISTWV